MYTPHPPRPFTLFIAAPLALCLSAHADAPSSEATPLARSVAEAYGLSRWQQVDALSYTFNVARDGQLKASRTWTWRPHDGAVTLTSKGADGQASTIRWSAGHPGDDTAAQSGDKAFINDQYWLLFPLHLVWDDGATLTDLGSDKRPTGEGDGHRLAVQYSGEVGYTPGDRYDLWLDEAAHLTHWAYTPSGAAEPKLVASWSAPQALGPLNLSLSHTDATGAFALWFSDVTVTTSAGSFTATAPPPVTLTP